MLSKQYIGFQLKEGSSLVLMVEWQNEIRSENNWRKIILQTDYILKRIYHVIQLEANFQTLISFFIY